MYKIKASADRSGIKYRLFTSSIDGVRLNPVYHSHSDLTFTNITMTLTIRRRGLSVCCPTRAKSTRMSCQIVLVLIKTLAKLTNSILEIIGVDCQTPV